MTKPADKITGLARAAGIAADQASARLEREETLADGTHVSEFSAIGGVTLQYIEVREYARGSTSTRVMDELSTTLDIDGILSGPDLSTSDGSTLTSLIRSELQARYPAEIGSGAAAERKADLIVAALLNLVSVNADNTFTIKGA